MPKMTYITGSQYLVIGDACSGKTCLLQRLRGQRMSKLYISTIGVIPTEIEVNGRHITFLDTAGQLKFGGLMWH